MNTAIFSVMPAASAALLSLVLVSRPVAADLERRMTIEVDGNSICFAIADVTHDDDRVHRYLDYGCMDSGFDDDLAVTGNQYFSQVVLRRARSLFQKMRARQEHFRASRVRALARPSLQAAHNAGQLIEGVRRTTGIDVHILSPEEEERVDFYSALGASRNSETPVVWDIGKGRYQMILANDKDGPLIHKSEFGSAGFMAYLKEVVQDKSSTAPHALAPMSVRELNDGMAFARYLARRTPAPIRDELKKDAVAITGIGAFFRESFALDQADRLMSREKLRHFIYARQTTVGVNDLSVANAILVLGFMDELNIKNLRVSDHNSTVGMLELPILWHSYGGH